MTPTIDYHDRLRRARIQAGMDQRTLAGRIGCSPSTVSAVEAGKQELGALRLFAWATACAVSLDWIAAGKADG